MNKFLIAVLVLAVVFSGYYIFFYTSPEIQEEEPVEIANPASVYCVENGGTLERFVFESGEDNYCVFDDNSKCWEWDFFQGSCTKGQLKINVLEEGRGKPVERGDGVLVHYTGKLLDGVIFDSSYDRMEPFSFIPGAGMVISGWEQGVVGMRPGETRELTIGPDLAYGPYGAGEVIPPNATLVFEIKLLEIK